MSSTTSAAGPNTEGGSLDLAHVPYAFKVACFKEAKRLGFKRVLWLDTAVVPLASLNTVFGMIQNKGYFVLGGGRLKVGPYMNPIAAAYFGVTLAETQEIPSCSAGLFGVDLTTEIGQTIIDRWDRAAHDSDAFYSARSDQNAVSIILHQLGIEDFIPWSLLSQTDAGDAVKPGDLFVLDRGGKYVP